MGRLPQQQGLLLSKNSLNSTTYCCRLFASPKRRDNYGMGHTKQPELPGDSGRLLQFTAVVVVIVIDCFPPPWFSFHLNTRYVHLDYVVQGDTIHLLTWGCHFVSRCCGKCGHTTSQADNPAEYVRAQTYDGSSCAHKHSERLRIRT